MKKSFPVLFKGALVFIAFEIMCKHLGRMPWFAGTDTFHFVGLGFFIGAGILWLWGVANFLGNWISTMKIAKPHIHHIMLAALVVSGFSMLNSGATAIWCLMTDGDKVSTVITIGTALILTSCATFFIGGLASNQSAKEMIDLVEAGKRREELLEAMKRRI
jgi:hypothetical protein